MPIRDAAAMSGEDKPDDTEMNDVVAKEIRLGHGLWLQRLMAGEFTRLKCACVLECPEHVLLCVLNGGLCLTLLVALPENLIHYNVCAVRWQP